MLIGARVAPFSPVGCIETKIKTQIKNKTQKTSLKPLKKSNLPEPDGQLNCSKQQISQLPTKFVQKQRRKKYPESPITESITSPKQNFSEYKTLN